MLRISHSPSRVAELLAELSQIVGEGGLGGIGEVAAAQPIRAALHAVVEIVLVHAIERATQLAGSRGLGRRELARRGADLLREVRQVVAYLLAIVHHFVDVFSGKVFRPRAGGSRGASFSDYLAHAIGLRFLLRRQLFGGLGHGIETAGGILLLHAAQQVGSFAQAVGGAARIGRAGALGDGALHVFVGLTQTVKRLLSRLLAAVGGLGGGLLRICGPRAFFCGHRTGLRTSRLPAALACLPAGLSAGLPGSGSALTLLARLALLTLLPLLSLLTLLSLLALLILTQLLLHLPLELLRIALQHFLLPFLFGSLLCAVALLLG